MTSYTRQATCTLLTFNFHFSYCIQDLGACANPMFKLKGPAMIENRYPPAFPLKHQQKDMRLALSLGDEQAVSMPIAAASNEVKIKTPFYFPSL